MSDEEITTNNPMDVDILPNESSSSPAPESSTVVLDIGIGSGYISGSDDEDMNEPVTSKSSTPDSTTLPTSITRKPLSTSKHPLTKSSFFFYDWKNTFHHCFYFVDKSSLVNYERDSDDDEHTDDEEEDEENNELQDGEDEQSNSNSAGLLHGTGDVENQIESATFTEQTLVTSDLLNVTPVPTISFASFFYRSVYFLFIVQVRRSITIIS